MKHTLLIALGAFVLGALALTPFLGDRGPAPLTREMREHQLALARQQGQLAVQEESERGRSSIQTESERGRLSLWQTLLTQAPARIELDAHTLLHVPELVDPGGPAQRLEHHYYEMRDGALVEVAVRRLEVASATRPARADTPE